MNLLKLLGKVSMLLLILIPCAMTAAAQDRWEYIGTDVEESKCYLDLRTVVRPEKNVVIFWQKRVPLPDPSTSAVYTTKTRFKMYRNRTFQIISERGYSGAVDIQPDSMAETFYYRLFR